MSAARFVACWTHERQPGIGEGSGAEIRLSRLYGFISHHQVIDLRCLHDRP